MNTEESNKLIAEFMDRYKGFHITECEDPIVISVQESKWGDDTIETLPFSYSDLKYHTSWDWLMPVVEKIESMGYIFEIWENGASIYKPFENSDDNEIKADTKINAAYQKVVDFIKLNNYGG